MSYAENDSLSESGILNYGNYLQYQVPRSLNQSPVLMYYAVSFTTTVAAKRLDFRFIFTMLWCFVSCNILIK